MQFPVICYMSSDIDEYSKDEYDAPVDRKH